MVSRYIKRAQTRLCDGETRLAPGSENESTDVLFEKTRRERVVRTLLLLFFLRSTPARSSSSQKFFLSREEEETLIRKKKNGEKTRAKKTASLSLSFRGKTTKSAFVHSFLRAKTRSNGRKVVRNEMVSTLCKSARNKLYEKK